MNEQKENKDISMLRNLRYERNDWNGRILPWAWEEEPAVFFNARKLIINTRGLGVERERPPIQELLKKLTGEDEKEI